MAATILSHQSSSGFYKAPVCKGLLSSIFATFTVAHVPVLSLSPYLRAYASCEIPSTLTSTQIWRLILNRFTCTYSKDFICAALLLYYFRVFERRMGSRKFASYVFGTCSLATLLEIFAILFLSSYLKAGQDDGKKFLPPGLFSLVFPLFVTYFMEIPRITVTKFFGVPITLKTLTYLLGLQMACNSMDSLIATGASLMAGLLYYHNVLYVRKWLVVPELISNLCGRLFGWAFLTSKPVLGQMGATVELQRQEELERYEQQYLNRRAHDFHSGRQMNQIPDENFMQQQGPDERSYLRQLFFPHTAGDRPGQQLVQPSDENLQILLQMGFDRSRALDALRASGNDLSTATSILLRQ